MLQPSISALVSEVTSRLVDQSYSKHFDQVVIAGEGEPTLRMDALLAIARTVQSRQRDGNYNNTREQPDTRQLPIRLITNGLCYGITNFGYSPYNSERNGTIVPLPRHVVLRDMLDAGISRLSVALNTANRHEYDLLMEPQCGEMLPGTAHDIVCELIMEATKLGMDVEITGIDRPEIDKVEMERLARLLLSVGPNKYTRRRMIRWRPYFPLGDV